MNIPFDFTTTLSVILALVVLVLSWMVYTLDKKLSTFLIGKETKNLGESLSVIDNSIKDLESFRREIESYLITVEDRLRKSTQHIHTIRFNPFAGSTGSGGNQSFATAFLNELGDGVVISSLYAREHVSIFAKPITNGTSEYELSSEEAQAVKEARKIAK